MNQFIETSREKINDFRQRNRYELVGAGVSAVALAMAYFVGKSRGRTTVEVNLISKDDNDEFTKTHLGTIK